MRKLGKTFTKRYNFKRLLKTAPDLVTLYNKQEHAVNSIEPIKFVQLMEDAGPIAACSLNPSPNETTSLEVFGPTSPNEWPSRIKYAEQIHDLDEYGYACVWTVRLVENPKHNPVTWADRVRAQVKRVSNPQVVTFWPHDLGKLIPPTNVHRVVDPEHLSRIDEGTESFFLSDRHDKGTPQELSHCGIIPHERHLWNATFYDYGIAHLYAESVEHQLRI